MDFINGLKNTHINKFCIRMQHGKFEHSWARPSIGKNPVQEEKGKQFVIADAPPQTHLLRSRAEGLGAGTSKLMDPGGLTSLAHIRSLARNKPQSPATLEQPYPLGYVVVNKHGHLWLLASKSSNAYIGAVCKAVSQNQTRRCTLLARSPDRVCPLH